MRERTVKFDGRVLYITEDEKELKAQLYDGVPLDYDENRKLVDNISTDERLGLLLLR